MCDNRLNDMLMNTRRAIAIVEQVSGVRKSQDFLYDTMEYRELAVGDSVYDMRSVLTGLRDMEQTLDRVRTIDMEEETS